MNYPSSNSCPFAASSKTERHPGFHLIGSLSSARENPTWDRERKYTEHWHQIPSECITHSLIKLFDSCYYYYYYFTTLFLIIYEKPQKHATGQWTQRYFRIISVLFKKKSDARQAETPTQSPDLNPITLVWDELERQVKAKQPAKASHPQTMLQESWNELTEQCLWSLLKLVSMLFALLF